MIWIQEQAEEKLTVYRREAALRRQLPARMWRGRVAQLLRGAAERLEPSLNPVQEVGQFL